MLVARSRDELDAIAREIGGGAVAEAADLTDDEAVHDLAARVVAGHGRVDVLVHSAAMLEIGAVADAPVADLDRQFRLNVRAPYVLTQALLPALLEARGQIVFVNSTAGLDAPSGSSQYAATKYALRGLADALRAEVNEAGVRVISVFPDRTATPMQERLHRLEGKPYRPDVLLQPDDVAQAALAALLAGPTAQITEITVRPL